MRNRLRPRAGNDKDLLGAVALTRAKILLRQGEADQAIATYNKALDLGSESPSTQWAAHAGLGAIYGAGKDAARANAQYEQALKVIAANRADQLKTDYKITFLSNLIRFYQEYVALLSF